MKVRSNPAQGAVMYPLLRGVYIGATAKSENGSISFEFSPEPVELLADGESPADFFKRHPHEFAYLVKKVQEGELFAADEEMAKAAGVKLAPSKTAKSAPLDK